MALPPTKHALGLACVSLVLVAAGYQLGALGMLPGSFSQHVALSPEARLGFALQAAPLQGDAHAWDTLRQDVQQVGDRWPAAQRAVLELLVAVRGLQNGGAPEFQRAQQLCEQLRWPRCDRVALDRLQASSAP